MLNFALQVSEHIVEADGLELFEFARAGDPSKVILAELLHARLSQRIQLVGLRGLVRRLGKHGPGAATSLVWWWAQLAMSHAALIHLRVDGTQVYVQVNFLVAVLLRYFEHLGLLLAVEPFGRRCRIFDHVQFFGFDVFVRRGCALTILSGASADDPGRVNFARACRLAGANEHVDVRDLAHFG